MKTLLNYTQFSEVNESVNLLAENFEVSLDQELNEKMKEGTVKQVAAWIFLPKISIVKALYQLHQKKVKVKGMLDAEKDPKKKELLKQELKAMKYEEVKVKEKMEIARKKQEMKAKEAKAKMSPAEKAELNREIKQYKQEYAAAQAELDKVKSQNNGIV